MSQWFVLKDDSAGADTITPLLAALHTATSDRRGGTQVQSIRTASHDATILLVKSDITDAERTGSLAALARDQEGVGIYKGEFWTQAEKERLAFGLVGEGDYAGRVLYIRPRSTFALTTGSPTRITSYGDNSGKTFGDAVAGLKGWQDILASVTGVSMICLTPGEYFFRDEDIRLDSVGVANGSEMKILPVAEGSSNAVRTQVRHDYHDLVHNGVTFDRAVIYGGLRLDDTTVGFDEHVVDMPFTSTVALDPADIGRRITMDTDLDTGLIAGYDANTIWILRDAAAGNEFDDSPTAGGTFTITAGVGAGSQNSAATVVTGVYAYRDMPGNTDFDGSFAYDMGSAFGNGVHKDSGSTRNPSWGGTLNVMDADGGKVLEHRADMATLLSEGLGALVPVTGAGGPGYIKLPDNSDPTNRVCWDGFGFRIKFGEGVTGYPYNIDWVKPTIRWLSYVANFPETNVSIIDPSIKFSNGPVLQANTGIATYVGDPTNWLHSGGYVSRGFSGVYHAIGKSDPQAHHWIDAVIEDVVVEGVGGVIADEANSDGHSVAFQGNSENVTIRRIYTRTTGGSVGLYQWGPWVANPYIHPMGTVLVEDCDIDNTVQPAFWPNLGANSSDVGLHLTGDNNDEAHLGDGKAVPPTTKQDTSDVTIRRIKVRGPWTAAVRNKWRDYVIDFSFLDLDGATALFKTSGAGSDWANVVRLPYTESVALINSDVGKVITMDTDGDTGTIIDFDGSDILINTDGAAGNSFDNSPTSDDTFTITTGTGAGSQNGAGAYEPRREPKSKLRDCTFGADRTWAIWLETSTATGDYIIDSDDNTFVGLSTDVIFKSAEFGEQTFAQWQANTRAGCVFDPNSTLIAP